ncbi:MAG: hypothetical protein JWP44_4898 [Mucilaginibacter sp.]|nr:hypothetical protein [Mucilaginibacter sp.]
MDHLEDQPGQGSTAFGEQEPQDSRCRELERLLALGKSPFSSGVPRCRWTEKCRTTIGSKMRPEGCGSAHPFGHRFCKEGEELSQAWRDRDAHDHPSAEACCHFRLSSPAQWTSRASPAACSANAMLRTAQYVNCMLHWRSLPVRWQRGIPGLTPSAKWDQEMPRGFYHWCAVNFR